MSPHEHDTPPGGESLASIRGYLLHLADQHLEGELHAKGGASDIVQATLLAAHQSQNQFRGENHDQYKGWIRQILVNIVRKFRRRWRTEARAISREVSLDQLPTLRLRRVHHETPSHLARLEESRQLLAEAVLRLSPDLRQVVTWRVEQELTFAEIAVRLGKSPNGARLLFQAALDQLQRFLPHDEAILRGAS